MNFGLSTTVPNFGHLVHPKSSSKPSSQIFRPETLEVDIAQLFDQAKKSHKYNFLCLVGSQNHQNQIQSQAHDNNNTGVNICKNNNLNKRPHTTRPGNGSNNNNMEQNGSEDKTINKDKPRFPDIQMINKYYGLVPKKFTVHSRQSLEQAYTTSGTGRRLRAKSAFIPSSKSKPKTSHPSSPSSSDQDNNQGFADKRKSRSKHNGKANTTTTNGAKGKAPLLMQMHSQTGESQATQPVHLQTRKLPVERQNRLLKNRGRSSSLPVTLPQDAFIKKEEVLSKFNKERQQRTIRIDLHKMSWEQDCSSCSQEASISRSPSLESLEDDELSKQDNYNGPELKGSRESVGEEIGNANQDTRINDSLTILTQINANILEEGNSPVVDGVKASCEEEDDVDNACTMRKGVKKTTSFDEQVFGMTSSIPTTDKRSRPMTATSNLNTSASQGNQQILPWTQRSGKSLSLSERRAKFQRSVSIHSSTDKSNTTTPTSTSISMSLSTSLDFGEECSDSEMMTNFVSKALQSQATSIQPVAPGRNSSAYKETKKALFFKPAPEVSTLVSQISPIDNLDVQVEIEKVAVMLSQNKSFSESQEDREGSQERQDGRDVNGNVLSGKLFQTSFEDPPKVASYPFHPTHGQLINRNFSSESAKPTKITPVQNNYPGSEPVKGSQKSGQLQESRPRPILKKAVSISCESELGARASGERNNGSATDNNGISGTRSSRPKTALLTSKQPPKLQRHSSSPSLMAQENGKKQQTLFHKPNSNSIHQNQQPFHKPQAQGQGSKVIIKKALMEINQASVQLITKRPKTAPNDARKGGKGRLPLKVSPAPLIMVGNKSKPVLGTKAIPPLAMGRSKQGQENGSGGQSQQNTAASTGNSQDPQPGTLPNPQQSSGRNKLQRQSFSLDEGMLLSFSNKEFGWDEEAESNPGNGKQDSSPLSRLGDTGTGSNDGIHETGNDRKREQCLKIYQKMLKSGMNVKLDTIFRGMMTPSEYRVFIKAAEAAAKQLALEEEERKQKELEERKSRREKGKLVSEISEDAGVFKPEVRDSEVKS